MRAQRLHMRWLVVAGVAALVAAAIVPAAAAKPDPAPVNDSAPTIHLDGWAYQYAGPTSSTDNAWADQIVDPYGKLALRELEQKGEFIPGVTDSTTGVVRELERKGYSVEDFLPGVTDSSTGVTRDLERRGLEPQTIPSSASASAADSGFHYEDAAIGMGAVLAAAILMAACAALVAGERRRRRPAV
jgi:hypothetical protein